MSEEDECQFNINIGIVFYINKAQFFIISRSGSFIPFIPFFPDFNECLFAITANTINFYLEFNDHTVRVHTHNSTLLSALTMSFPFLFYSVRFCSVLLWEQWINRKKQFIILANLTRLTIYPPQNAHMNMSMAYGLWKETNIDHILATGTELANCG